MVIVPREGSSPARCYHVQCMAESHNSRGAVLVLVLVLVLVMLVVALLLLLLLLLPLLLPI